MAKSAIGGLVKSLAVEYARFGVTVNCVAPSMMETNFLKDTPDLIVQAAAEEIKLRSRQYGKRQLTWFRRDPEIRWFRPDDDAAMINYIDFGKS